MNLDNIKYLEKCYCGRPNCQFFNGLDGEWGSSYSTKQVKQALKNAKIAVRYLEKLLEKKA